MDCQNNKCDKENLIRQLVKVQAQVSVTPDVRNGTPKVTCLDSCIKPNSYCCGEDCYECRCCDRKCYDYDRCWHNQFNCDYESDYDDYRCENSDYDYDSVSESSPKFNYTLTQVICIEIPISIDVDIDIKESITCCGKPEIKLVDDKKRQPYYMQMI